ncbi:serine/threonine-protein kinase HAL4/sat4 [Physocladia obscura]|uniref:Serine/threonine-protein kinase HAL4/sat4 n=1 Tax=Physocladia obscura TaxID=109957 RepID=A0AAD5SR59_9FUNG|nr:serine/threonine-protein kinase HAL4/sat4 [Physocladia obscura]
MEESKNTDFNPAQVARKTSRAFHDFTSSLNLVGRKNKNEPTVLYRIFHPQQFPVSLEPEIQRNETNDLSNSIIVRSRRFSSASDASFTSENSESDSDLSDTSDTNARISLVEALALTDNLPPPSLYRSASVASLSLLQKTIAASSATETPDFYHQSQNNIIKSTVQNAVSNGMKRSKSFLLLSKSKDVFGEKSDDSNHEHKKAFLSRTASVASIISEKYGISDKRHELGRGTTAVVRLCSPVGSDKKFAIKEYIRRKKGESPKSYAKKVIAEFCISSSLEHDNVIKTVDLIQDERKKWCVVMEYADSGSLYTKITSGQLTLSSSIYCYLKQLIRGVFYLHSVGVAHRDLKPENLLLTNDGSVLKITDFGTSAVFRAPLESRKCLACGECGSEPYIAPEVFSNHEYDAELADIWSVGIILYTMLFNSTPWKAAKSSDGRYQTFAENMDGFWYKFKLVPHEKEVRRLFVGFLMVNPDIAKRLKTPEILKDDWLAGISYCETGQPVHGHHHNTLSE